MILRSPFRAAVTVAVALFAAAPVARAQQLPVPVGAPVGADSAPTLPPPGSSPSASSPSTSSSPSSSPSASSPSASSPSASSPSAGGATARFVQVSGRGFGHGRGLGQWGSYGYAVDLGWTSARILDHYYGGTVAGTLNPPPVQRVRLQSFDGKAVTIVQPRGTLSFGVASLSSAGAAPTGALTPVVAGSGATVAASGDAGPTVPGVVAVASAGPGVPVVAAGSSPPALPAPGSSDTVPPPVTPAPVTPAGSVAAPGGLSAASAVAVRIQQIGTNRWQISDGPGCDGPFTPRSVLEGPAVLFTVDPSGGSLDASRNPDPAEMIQVCVGSVRRAYRGALVAATEGSATRLISVVPMEAYLRSVVPSESPPKWADRPNGIEALKAQSVAARSYAAAERRSGPANTCDTTACQVYRGRGEFRGGSFTSFEDARTDRAIAETAGVVRLWPNGSVVRTEFSSSTGGWTAPGEFPVVADEGDATTANPYRQWTVRLPVERLEAGRGLGSFVGAEVTRRDGTGPDGGRARRVRLSFTGGAVDLPSSELSGRFGFRSSYYSLAVMERPAGTTLDVGDVFQPTDSVVAAAAGAPSSGSSGPAPGVSPSDGGAVMAGTPDVLPGPDAVIAGAGLAPADSSASSGGARTATTVRRRTSATPTTKPAPATNPPATNTPATNPPATNPAPARNAAPATTARAGGGPGPVPVGARPATNVSS